MSHVRSEGPLVLVVLQVLGGILTATCPQPVQPAAEDRPYKAREPCRPTALVNMPDRPQFRSTCGDILDQRSPSWLWTDAVLQSPDVEEPVISK